MNCVLLDRSRLLASVYLCTIAFSRRKGCSWIWWGNVANRISFMSSKVIIAGELGIHNLQLRSNDLKSQSTPLYMERPYIYSFSTRYILEYIKIVNSKTFWCWHAIVDDFKYLEVFFKWLEVNPYWHVKWKIESDETWSTSELLR